MPDYESAIAAELRLGAHQVAAVSRLLDEGGTIPFIARYRKEATGSLDEVAVASIRDRREELRDLDKRRAAILESLGERDLLTGDLKRRVDGAASLVLLEDIYPYTPLYATEQGRARDWAVDPEDADAFVPAHWETSARIRGA